MAVVAGRSTRSLERTMIREYWNVLAILLAAIPFVASAVNDVVYNHVAAKRTPLDNTVREQFGRRYNVVEFTDTDHSWIYPRPIASPQASPVYLDNRCIAGHALVVYIISVDGSVSDGFAAQTTNSFLGAVAVELAKQKRFVPGQLDGRVVSSVAASRFRFPCPQEAK